MGEIIILLLAILAIPAFVMFLGWIAGHGRTREDRNKFMDETVGMKKDDRQNYFDNFYK